MQIVVLINPNLVTKDSTLSKHTSLSEVDIIGAII